MQQMIARFELLEYSLCLATTFCVDSHTCHWFTGNHFIQESVHTIADFASHSHSTSYFWLYLRSIEMLKSCRISPVLMMFECWLNLLEFCPNDEQILLECWSNIDSTRHSLVWFVQSAHLVEIRKTLRSIFATFDQLRETWGQHWCNIRPTFGRHSSVLTWTSVSTYADIPVPG